MYLQTAKSMYFSDHLSRFIVNSELVMSWTNSCFISLNWTVMAYWCIRDKKQHFPILYFLIPLHTVFYIPKSNLLTFWADMASALPWYLTSFVYHFLYFTPVIYIVFYYINKATWYTKLLELVWTFYREYKSVFKFHTILLNQEINTYKK